MVSTDPDAPPRIPRARRRPERNSMSQWRVRDVMTTEVINASDDASVAEIVAVLTDRQITAVPIVDRFDVVLGVVSWTDLRDKIDIRRPDGEPHVGWWRRWTPSLVRWPEGTAVEVMSGPALTIAADASLSAAARVMYRSEVGRLLVVDGDNRLRGIITRSDLLKVHARLDAVIRDEVIHRVLHGTLAIPPGDVQATVDDGVVTLTGRIASKMRAVAAVQLTEAVPGVTDVVDHLTFNVDDTAAAGPSRRAERDPLLGWWIGRTPVWSGAQVVPAGRTGTHDKQAATRSAASQ
jgi:CBS domain-containing protein